jgi:hypothetical protein
MHKTRCQQLQPEQRRRRALLEIGAAAAADQQAVAGEGHAVVVEHIAQAAAGDGALQPQRRRPAFANGDKASQGPRSQRPACAMLDARKASDDDRQRFSAAIFR